MPIYEYQCKKCGQVTEIMQKISDAPLKSCPDCGGKVGKLISMNTFHLKGSGWYVTDYAGKSGASPKEKAPKKAESKESTCAATPKSDNS